MDVVVLTTAAGEGDASTPKPEVAAGALGVNGLFYVFE